jgi:hypothetical protein
MFMSRPSHRTDDVSVAALSVTMNSSRRDSKTPDEFSRSTIRLAVSGQDGDEPVEVLFVRRLDVCRMRAATAASSNSWFHVIVVPARCAAMVIVST